MNNGNNHFELENVLNSMTGPVYIINKDFELEFVNRGCEEVFGRHTPGTKCYEYFHNLGSSCDWCMHTEVLNGKNHRSESYFNNIQTYFEANQSPLRKSNGEISMLVILRDIRERKRSETALRESEEQFHGLFNSMAEGFALHEVIYDDKETATDYMIVKANRAFETLTGLLVKDAEGKRATELYGTDKPPYFDIFMKVVKTGEPHDFVTYFEPMKKYFRISVFSPAKRKFATVFDDITERVLAEEALRASEAYFREVFDNTVHGIFVVEVAQDGNFLIKDANKTYEILTAQSDTIRGKLLTEAFPPDIAQHLHTNFSRCVDTGNHMAYEESIDLGLGLIYFYTTLAPVRDRQGRICLIIGSTFEITARKKVERILQLRLSLIEYSESNPINLLIRRALDEICDMTGSPIGFYHLYEEDRKMLTLTEWSSRTSKEFCKTEGRGMHYSIDKAGVWCDCLRERRPVIHNDYASLPSRRGLPPGHAEVVREMVIPIIHDGRIVSVMGVGNKPTDYDDHDLNIATNVADIIWSIVARKQASDALDQRVKELDCLYEISKLLIEPSNTLEDIINSTIGIIPRSWKYSDITCARIFLEGRTYKPDDFVETPWRQASPIRYQRSRVGIVEVFYREERSPSDEGPFLAEERALINGVSELLSIAYGNKKIEEKLKLLNKAMDTIEVGVTIADVNGEIIYTNPAEATMHGYAVEELIGRQASLFAPSKPRRSGSDADIEDMAHWKRESINVSVDGSTFPVQLISIPVKDSNGKAIGLVTVSEDISERKRLEEQLKHLAITDPLTGCYNRRHFFDLGEKEVYRSLRYGRALSVLMMDIDYFKAINDTYGHATGDRTLTVLSKTCLSMMRNTDIFGRLGGEEFGIIFIESGSKDAVEMAGRLRSELSKIAVPADKDMVRFTVSFGVSEIRHGDQSLEEILKRADRALYEAKNAGRDCVRSL